MSKFPLVKLLILSLMLAVFITMQLWNRLDFFVATPSGGQRASFSSSLSSFPDDDASLSRIEHVQDVLNCTTLKECIEQLTQIFLQKNGDDRCTEIGKTDKNCDKNGNEPHNITAQNKDNSIVKAITESSSERSSPLAQQQQRRRRGILFTSQCSGSEWLASSLNDARRGMVWGMEALISYSRNGQEWEHGTQNWTTYQRRLEAAFPPFVENDAKNETTKTRSLFRMSGFKLMYDQLPKAYYADFAEWAVANNIFVLHLRRRCAALQFASQIQKAQRLIHVKKKQQQEKSAKNGKINPQNERQKVDVDHFTNQTVLQSLASSIQKVSLERPQFRNVITTLQNNQEQFSRYLRLHLAGTPVMELSYEDLDGPHQANWFRSIMGFLGAPRLEEEENSVEWNMIKTGSRLCEDRLQHLGGPDYNALSEPSRLECMRLRQLYQPNWYLQREDDDSKTATRTREQLTTMANATTSTSSTIRSLPATFLQQLRKDTFPNPRGGYCYLSPSCEQWQYMRQYNLMQNVTL